VADTPPSRGDVWLVRFDPSIGGEIRKTRPAVLLSSDQANAVLNRVQVVPISSQVASLYPAEAFVTLNGERRKAMADQIKQGTPVVKVGLVITRGDRCRGPRCTRSARHLKPLAS
jgi:mRNA interferase MazF